MPSNAKNAPRKILIVEEEEILLEALNLELLSAGFDVISAVNGEAGIKMIKTHRPDLVLLDLMLPGKNGFEVLEVIKKDSKVKNIPIMVLTNLDQDEDRAKAMKLGALEYHVKSSTDLEDLTKEIKKILK